MDRPFTLLIKPAGADCNLRCEYCFYLPKRALYPGRRRRMSDEVLERLISSYMATEQPHYGFCWQGGEPTLMGLDFFRRVTELQQQHGVPGAIIANSLQTNAVRIDRELAVHLSRFRFLVGCSLDGPAEVHDRYRRTVDGGPTHGDVLQGIRMLQAQSVAVNALVLVSQANVRRAREILEYLVELDLWHQQFIPCVEFNASGELQPYAITGAEWGDFLCELFEAWRPELTTSVAIRNFDAILQQKVDGDPGLCTMRDRCGDYFVVEHNGDVYPCDFYVDSESRLANIRNMSWRQIRQLPAHREFCVRKGQVAKVCGDCDCLELCYGDCPRQRDSTGPVESEGAWLCDGWRRFNRHTGAEFDRLAEQVRAMRR